MSVDPYLHLQLSKYRLADAMRKGRMAPHIKAATENKKPAKWPIPILVLFSGYLEALNRRQHSTPVSV